MKLVLPLLAMLSLAGCGGVLVLESRNGVPERQPVPVPARQCYPEEISSDQAVQAVAAESARRHIAHLAVKDVERHKRYWDVEMRGRSCGNETKIHAKVDRRTGELLAYRAKVADEDDED